MEYSFEAIGTHWQLTIEDSITQNHFDKLVNSVRSRIEIFDQTYSRFRDDSLIMQMAKKAGTYTLPDDAPPLFNLYHELYQITDGIFTPLVGQLLSDAGYDSTYTLQQSTLRQPPTWEDVLSYKHPQLTLTQPAILDFGAAGKGYLVDLVSEMLESEKITSYCVDASGDIRYHQPNQQPIKVGLEHPNNPNQVIGIATLTNKSICGSAGNRRSWNNFHHIINPHELRSPTNIVASWVVADSTLLADALATALFLVPVEILRPHFEFEYLLITEQGAARSSKGFPAELFSA